MKKKQEQKRPISVDRLNEIIKKWKINLGVLSAETGIAKTTLSNMLNPNLPQYYLDDQQYSDVVHAVGKIGLSTVEFFKQELKVIKRNNTSSKK